MYVTIDRQTQTDNGGTSQWLDLERKAFRFLDKTAITSVNSNKETVHKSAH